MGTADDPVREYARLLLRYHELDPRGESESPEVNAICEAMDSPWQRMDRTQRQRMRGLSQDLYALADGRQGAHLQQEDLKHWAEENRAALARRDDPDLLLEHLRRPYPHDFPAGVIPFLQARSWVQLGLPEVAVLFYQEAGKALPATRAAVMDCYMRMNRPQEAAEIAWQLLREAQSRPPDVYLATVTLFLLASRLEPESPKALFDAIVDRQRRLFEELSGTPAHSRDDPGLVNAVARALAFTLLQLDRREELRQLCARVLEHSPNDPALLLVRGLVNLLDNSISAAESDFQEAIQGGSRSGLPHAVLAWFHVGRGEYSDVLRLSSQAISFPDLATEIRGLMFELRGIALGELKHQRDRVEEDFAKALSLNPTSAGRIEHNRRVAIEALQSSKVPRAEGWAIPDVEPEFWLLLGLRNALSPVRFQDRLPGEAFSELVTTPTS